MAARAEALDGRGRFAACVPAAIPWRPRARCSEASGGIDDAGSGPREAIQRHPINFSHAPGAAFADSLNGTSHSLAHRAHHPDHPRARDSASSRSRPTSSLSRGASRHEQLEDGSSRGGPSELRGTEASPSTAPSISSTERCAGTHCSRFGEPARPVGSTSIHPSRRQVAAERAQRRDLRAADRGARTAPSR